MLSSVILGYAAVMIENLFVIAQVEKHKDLNRSYSLPWAELYIQIQTVGTQLV